jgi:MraZ protein
MSQEVDQEVTTLDDEIQGLGLFVGDYLHNLDPKKRLTIPSGWRAQVGTPRGLYVLPGLDRKCLVVFRAGEMARRLEKLRQHSMADPKVRQFARILGSSADLVPWDNHGRIRIKDKLLEYAGLTEQVVLMGALDRFELWNPEERKLAGEMTREDLEEAARYIGI